MNHQKRTLANAMTMTPEQRAFVQGEPAPAPRITPPLEKEVEIEKVEGPVENPSPSPAETSPSLRLRRATRRTRDLPSVEPTRFQNLKMPITTRLRPDLVARLRRLCLERRLAGTNPATLQEIVESALEDWLSDHSD